MKKSSRPGAGGEFWAIKGSWFSIEQDRLFCLLGPNGAGKTTTINCLTGVLPPSGGDALVYGESLSTPGGMDRIRWAGQCQLVELGWDVAIGWWQAVPPLVGLRFWAAGHPLATSPASTASMIVTAAGP